MKVDNLILHANDIIQNMVGDFHGTPIREYDLLNAELREISDTQQRVRYFFGSQQQEISILPGETIKDNLIRRETAAEVVGDDFYAVHMPKGKQIPLHEGLVQDPSVGALITWRPGNQNVAILHEGVSVELPV